MKEEFVKIQKGDVAAFKKVFEHYFEKLVLYSASYTKDVDSSKDIVQEVFMKIWDKRKSLRPETFNSYLYRATHNRTLNYLRNHKRVIPLEMLQGRFYQEDAEQIDLFQEGNIRKLLRAVSELPKKCKEIFVKTKLEGQTYKQTAQELNLSEKTVERQVGIGFKKVRKYFDEQKE